MFQELCYFDFFASEPKTIDYIIDPEVTMVTIIPRIEFLRVFTQFRSDDNEEAFTVIPLGTIVHFFVKPILIRLFAGQDINYLLDFYKKQVIELLPLDFENVMAKRCTLFSFGANDTKFIDETYMNFYRCHYLGSN